MPPESALPIRREKRQRWHTWIIVGLVVGAFIAGVLVIAYLARVVWLNLWAAEGEIPPVSSLSLPAGSEVVDEEAVGGTGGCTAIYTVRPPAGQSPAELAGELGATPETTVPGTFLDSRSIWLSAEGNGRSLAPATQYVTSE